MSLKKSTVQRRKTLVSKTALKFPFGESAICPTIRNHLLLSWMILIFCLIEHSQTSSPQNLAVVKGTKVRLTCSEKEHNSPSWSFYNYSMNQQERDAISVGEVVISRFKNRFSVEPSTNQDFVLSFTAYENASGLVTCQKDAKDGLQETAHVIVLDPRPTCSKTITEAGFTRVDCSIDFGGFWSPELEWRKADVKLETDNTNTMTTNKVTSSHLVKLKPSTSYDLTCTPKFTLKNKPEAKPRHTDAENIPEFPISCAMTIDILSEAPQNLAAVKGTKVRLNCSMKEDIHLIWIFYNYSSRNQTDQLLVGGGDLVAAYVEKGYEDRISIDNSTKGYLDLLLTAYESASGLFACQKDKKDELQETAHVIVLDPGPTCSKTKTEERYTRLDCSIGFSGFWSPELEWLKADVKLETNNTNTTNKVTSSHLVKLKPSVPYDLTCTAKFTLKNKPEAKPKHTVAENIPEFPNSCTMTIEKSDGKNERTNGTQKESLKGPLIGVPIDKDKDSGNFPTSATVSIHDWHNLHLSLSLTTLVVIGMLHKWLWQ